MSAWLVWSESTTAYNYCCCLLVFSDCGILFVTVIIYGSSYLPKFAKLYCYSNISQDVGMVGVIRKHNAIQLLLLFASFFWLWHSFCYRYHIRFIVFAKIPKTILLQQYFATCRSVGVIRKHNTVPLLLLFASFFMIPVLFLLQLSYTVHRISQNSQNWIATAVASRNGAMLVWSERTTIITLYCCLLIFPIVVLFLLLLSVTVHRICQNSQNYIATAILRRMSLC
jgi:hypothetical protein